MPFLGTAAAAKSPLLVGACGFDDGRCSEPPEGVKDAGVPHVCDCVFLINKNATIAVSSEKMRHDAVRPASLIPAMLRNTTDGAAFALAIRTMRHKEYSSASAAICAGFVHILSALGQGSPKITPIRIPLTAGKVGSGLPAEGTIFTFADINEVSDLCRDSPVWGGLHFPHAVTAGKSLGVAVAKEVLSVMACRAPGLPGLPPRGPQGGGGKQ